MINFSSIDAYLELVLTRCKEKIKKKKPQATFPCRHPDYAEVERKIVFAVRCDDKKECLGGADELGCETAGTDIILGGFSVRRLIVTFLRTNY